MSEQWRIRYINNLYNYHFKQINCDVSKMQEHFGMENTPNHIRKIRLERDEEVFSRQTLIIECYKREADVLDTYINGLPRDINNYIYSFLSTTIKLKNIIELPPDYPFAPPLWIPLEYVVDGVSRLKDKHQEFCNTDWSPALKLDKEILIYISTLEWL
jgi:hypothetical protein